MRVQKRHIAQFFLILFVSVKLLSLHTLEHTSADHVHDCDICHFIAVTSTTPFTTNEAIASEELFLFNTKKEVCFTYAYQFTPGQIDNSLFSRPPPTA